jgi:hypothetical protein
MGCSGSKPKEPVNITNNSHITSSENQPSSTGSSRVPPNSGVNNEGTEIDTNFAARSSMYKSRVMDHNANTDNATLDSVPTNEDVEIDNENDFSQHEDADKVAPLPTKFTPTFQAETNGVQWSNLYVNAGTLLIAISYNHS